MRHLENFIGYMIRRAQLAVFDAYHEKTADMKITTAEFSVMLLYAERFAAGDAFVFGPETAGLPDDVLATFPPEKRLRLPMRAGNRSLNLSNAAAVTVFEAWRQLGFPAGA